MQKAFIFFHIILRHPYHQYVSFSSLILASIISCYLMFENICLLIPFIGLVPKVSLNYEVIEGRNQKRRKVEWNKANDHFILDSNGWIKLGNPQGRFLFVSSRKGMRMLWICFSS